MEENLKNKFAEIIREFHNKSIYLPADFSKEYSIKRKKLPRKLKKQYKKENKIIFEVKVFDCMEYASLTIPII